MFSSVVVTYVLMIDKIKVEERTRWDATTNLILGLCREHTKHLSMNFCSIEDARAALQAVLDGTAHHYGGREPHG